ncbi:hypothetical protein L228DRAFT_259062 [Xylona heveae TC161]|uniref:Uncharacterized protein n=1 Tax=Xylona heveae (strain CBS 132557 / TC161) TaxID=1328760 RepID=A0A165J371_XYLHT|nr:hypothetical protein L228DRAFT_259062 [Xylona heveae TC161]KZF25669.1 hypothetical protein L228DRAFT_259062 [Xylona heveae TC161]
MACLLFVYARTSIQAAKRNAQRHREADGGQINWRNESLRRHGVLEPPEDQGVVHQLMLGRGGKDGAFEEAHKAAESEASNTPGDEALKKRMGYLGKRSPEDEE